VIGRRCLVSQLLTAEVSLMLDIISIMSIFNLSNFAGTSGSVEKSRTLMISDIGGVFMSRKLNENFVRVTLQEKTIAICVVLIPKSLSLPVLLLCTIVDMVDYDKFSMRFSCA